MTMLHAAGDRSWSAQSFDHSIGTKQHGLRDCKAECLRSFQVDDKLEFGRLLDRQVARLCAIHNALDVIRSPPIDHCPVGRKGEQAPDGAPTPIKTIGTSDVARTTATVADVVVVTITSGLSASSSVATPGNRAIGVKRLLIKV